MWLCSKIAGIRIKVTGKELIDKKGKYVFMANHLSFLDGPLLFLVLPQPIRVILKKSLFKIPVVGWGMKFVDFIPVDRMGFKRGKLSIQKAVDLMKAKNYSFLIFPEGTRSPNGKIMSFRKGGFYLSLNSGTPVVPISIHGTFDLMPKRKFWIKRGEVQVKYFSPVSVQKYSMETLPELMERIRSTIISGIEELEYEGEKKNHV